MDIRILRARGARTLVAGLVLAAVAASSSAARADVLNVETLDQLNLIVFGSATSSSSIDGRAVIGGSFAGTSDAFVRGFNLPPSNYAALTVGGSVGGTVNVDNGGNVIVGGS